MWVYRHEFSDRLLSKALAFFYGCQGTIPRVLQGEMYVFMIQLTVLLLAVFLCTALMPLFCEYHDCFQFTLTALVEYIGVI